MYNMQNLRTETHLETKNSEVDMAIKKTNNRALNVVKQDI